LSLRPDAWEKRGKQDSEARDIKFDFSRAGEQAKARKRPLDTIYPVAHWYYYILLLAVLGIMASNRHKAASFGSSELKAMEPHTPRLKGAFEPCLHQESQPTTTSDHTQHQTAPWTSADGNGTGNILHVGDVRITPTCYCCWCRAQASTYLLSETDTTTVLEMDPRPSGETCILVPSSIDCHNCTVVCVQDKHRKTLVHPTVTPIQMYRSSVIDQVKEGTNR
jgi:hypothetical protein